MCANHNEVRGFSGGEQFVQNPAYARTALGHGVDDGSELLGYNRQATRGVREIVLFDVNRGAKDQAEPAQGKRRQDMQQPQAGRVLPRQKCGSPRRS